MPAVTGDRTVSIAISQLLLGSLWPRLPVAGTTRRSFGISRAAYRSPGTAGPLGETAHRSFPPCPGRRTQCPQRLAAVEFDKASLSRPKVSRASSSISVAAGAQAVVSITTSYRDQELDVSIRDWFVRSARWRL